MGLTVMHQEDGDDAHGNHREEDQTIRQHASSPSAYHNKITMQYPKLKDES